MVGWRGREGGREGRGAERVIFFIFLLFLFVLPVYHKPSFRFRSKGKGSGRSGCTSFEGSSACTSVHEMEKGRALEEGMSKDSTDYIHGQ